MRRPEWIALMIDQNLQYLLLELGRIDVLIRRQVHLWELAGQNAKDQFRGLYITQNEARKISTRSIGMNWGSSVSLSSSDEKSYTSEYKSFQNQAAQKVTAEFSPRLFQLRQDFGLNDFEYNSFIIAAAPGLDLRYERIFGFLQDDVTRTFPTVSLILDLLLSSEADRISYLKYFTQDAPLIREGLIIPVENGSPSQPLLLNQGFVIAPDVLSWLLGAYTPKETISDFVSLKTPSANPASLLVPPEISSSHWQALYKEAPIIAFYGTDEQQKKTSALYIASVLNQPLLAIDLESLKTAGLLNKDSIHACLRDARLIHAMPFFTNWDYVLDEDGIANNEILAQIYSFNDQVLISSLDVWRIPGLSFSHEKPVVWKHFSNPGSQQRMQIWKYYLKEDSTIADEVIRQVSCQFTLSNSQILSAARSARDLALQQERKITSADLYNAARINSVHHLDRMAVKIQPRYGWNDVVLPEDEISVLREIVSTVRDRSLVLETWGLGKKLVASAGISALFAGEPGTGKTLSAQVIASELKMDLYKIDLSTVVSKYIGDTEKNLEQIFVQAKNSNSILFFDEADAIFGKRSDVKDAHDRYANIEVGYLLQRMETYDGIVILATNLRSNIDDAFTRRLQFVVDFPFPDESQRFEIWKVLFPPDVPREENIDFSYFANNFKLSGGSIRNIIVSASFKAASENQPVSTRHLMQSIRRELRKNGRLINEKDLVIV